MPRLMDLARPSSIAATSALAIMVATTVAHSQSADAEALFDDADKLMADGKLAEACTAFDASNRIEPRAGTLIRLGDCREKNHQLASAWSAYKDALSRVKDPRKRDIATVRVAALESRLSYLTVLVPDGSRVDGLTVTRNGDPLDAALWNRPTPLDGGSYVIAARADGYDVWHAEIVVPEQGSKQELEVPKLQKLVVPKPLVVAPSPPVNPTEQSRWTRTRIAAIGVAGGGVAALVVGGVLGLQAKSLQNDAFKHCPDPAQACADAAIAQHSLDSAHRRAIYADVGFGVGGGAIAAAVVLWLVGTPSPESNVANVMIRPTISTTAASLELALRF